MFRRELRDPAGNIRLPRFGTWKREPKNNAMTIEPSILANVTCGYIRLPVGDRRQIPGVLPLKGGGSVESFAFAAANAKVPEQMSKYENHFGSFISFIRQEAFADEIYTATEVLENVKDAKGNLVRLQLQGKIVIVAGHWHQFARDRGQFVDMHETPLDLMSGGLIHANFVEALLQNRIALPVPEWFPALLEVLVAVLAAAALALTGGFWPKCLLLGVITLFLLSIQFVTLNVLGVFLDGGVLLVGVWLHSLGEWVAEHID